MTLLTTRAGRTDTKEDEEEVEGVTDRVTPSVKKLQLLYGLKTSASIHVNIYHISQQRRKRNLLYIYYELILLVISFKLTFLSVLKI